MAEHNLGYEKNIFIETLSSKNLIDNTEISYQTIVIHCNDEED